MKIQANHSGTRSIDVTEQHLKTLDKYSLLRNLVDSNGIIDETVLDKALLDLCLDVIYNNNMKAFGLHQLVLLYIDWKSQQEPEEEANLQEAID